MTDRVTPEQMKRKVRERIAFEIAEKLYQADKASPLARLADLAPGLQGTYRAQGNQAVFGPQQAARINLIHVEQAHGHAVTVDDAERVRQQARRDVESWTGEGRY